MLLHSYGQGREIERGTTLPGFQTAGPSELVYRIAWDRVLQAMGKRLLTTDTPSSLRARYPEEAARIKAYVAARAKCATDTERREVRDRVLAPHCATLATRSLAAMRGGNRPMTDAEKRRRIAAIRARSGFAG